MLRLHATVAASALLASAGCTSVDSENILTSGIYASLSATANGEGDTRVLATLYVEDPKTLDFIELGPDDELWAYGPEGQDARMEEVQLLGITSYSAGFDTAGEGDEFVVEFVRDVDDGAPESRTTIPAPFDIVTDGGFEAKRSEELVVEYEPSGTPDQITWELEGTCIQRLSGELEEDSGAISIDAGRIEQRESEGAEESCEATLSVWRVREGDLDPGYGEGGRFRGRQERAVVFTSEP